MTATATAPAQAARNGRTGVRNRRLVGLILLLVLVVAAAVASIAVGTRSIGLGEVWRALLDADLSHRGGGDRPGAAGPAHRPGPHGRACRWASPAP